MALIVTTDLYTLLYAEVIEEITRQDATIIQAAIDAAIEEVSLYLSRYDLTALLGSGDTAPTVVSPLLKKICVSVACRYLAALANPNINYEHLKTNYEQTIALLKMIQEGSVNPHGWPYRDTTGQSAPQGSSVSATFYPKRKNGY